MNGVKDYPREVAIETINTCNARCPFCPLFQGSSQISRALRPAYVMNDELFERIVLQFTKWDRLPDTIFLNLNGEPLQDPRFIEHCRVLQGYRLGPRVELQSNAYFLGPKEAEAILAAEIGGW
jgi:sulfatase maturation enzyme AslB (radical SAM superfamily)